MDFESYAASFRGLDRLAFSVPKYHFYTPLSAIRRVSNHVETFCLKPPPEGAVVMIEVDEMWHYLHDKANKLWIWTALDRASRRLIGWKCGGRDQSTIEGLLVRLRRWNTKGFAT